MIDICPRCKEPEAYGCGCTTHELSEWQADKIEGLEADLESAVEVAFKRGAVDWVRLNYPKMYDSLKEPKE